MKKDEGATYPAPGDHRQGEGARHGRPHPSTSTRTARSRTRRVESAGRSRLRRGRDRGGEEARVRAGAPQRPADRREDPPQVRLQSAAARASSDASLTERGAKDVPLAGATITDHRCRRHGAPQRPPADDGAFAIDDLPAGHLPASRSRPTGYVAQSYDETLDPGQEAKVDIRLAQRGRGAAPAHQGRGRRRGPGARASVRRARSRSARSSSASSRASPAPTATRSARSRTCPASRARRPSPGLLIVRGAAPQRDERLRRRHARADRLPLRRSLQRHPDGDAREDRLLPRQLQHVLRARHGRDRRRRRQEPDGAARTRRSTGSRRPISSTRASSPRVRSPTPAGTSPSPGVARTSTSG